MHLHDFGKLEFKFQLHFYLISGSLYYFQAKQGMFLPSARVSPWYAVVVSRNGMHVLPCQYEKLKSYTVCVSSQRQFGLLALLASPPMQYSHAILLFELQPCDCFPILFPDISVTPNRNYPYPVLLEELFFETPCCRPMRWSCSREKCPHSRSAESVCETCNTPFATQSRRPGSIVSARVFC